MATVDRIQKEAREAPVRLERSRRMGDSVSINFKKGEDESVTLFSHWGGMEFVTRAENYMRLLKAERSGRFEPLDRLEPATVMVDFIRHITKGRDRVTSDLYLGKTPADGDNSDNGHHTIEA